MKVKYCDKNSTWVCLYTDEEAKYIPHEYDIINIDNKKYIEHSRTFYPVHNELDIYIQEIDDDY